MSIISGEPIDQTHAESLRIRDWMQQQFAIASFEVNRWTPRPCPPYAVVRRAKR